MLRRLFIAGLLATLAWSQADACTGISLATIKGATVHGRTIEWGNFDLNSRLVINNYVNLAPGTSPPRKLGESVQAASPAPSAGLCCSGRSLGVK